MAARALDAAAEAGDGAAFAKALRGRDSKRELLRALALNATTKVRRLIKVDGVELDFCAHKKWSPLAVAAHFSDADAFCLVATGVAERVPSTIFTIIARLRDANFVQHTIEKLGVRGSVITTMANDAFCAGNASVVVRLLELRAPISLDSQDVEALRGRLTRFDEHTRAQLGPLLERMDGSGAVRLMRVASEMAAGDVLAVQGLEGIVLSRENVWQLMERSSMRFHGDSQAYDAMLTALLKNRSFLASLVSKPHHKSDVFYALHRVTIHGGIHAAVELARAGISLKSNFKVKYPKEVLRAAAEHRAETADVMRQERERRLAAARMEIGLLEVWREELRKRHITGALRDAWLELAQACLKISEAIEPTQKERDVRQEAEELLAQASA